MKTVITIDNGRVEIQIDDQAPLLVHPAAAPHVKHPNVPPVSGPLQLPLVEVPSGPVLVKQPETSPPKKPAKSDPICISCGDAMPGRHARARYCGKIECKKAQRKQANDNYRGSKTGSTVRETINPPTPPVPNVPKNSPSNTLKFSDPWDCLKCRDLEQLCDLHKRLDADGKTPPRYV